MTDKTAIEAWNGQSEVVRRALEALRALTVQEAPEAGLSCAVLTGAPRTIPQPDPAAWAEDFHRWALERCVYNARWFTSMGALYRDFADWLISRAEAPPSEAGFEALMREAGFLFADGLVSALTLKKDVESYTESYTEKE